MIWNPFLKNSSILKSFLEDPLDDYLAKLNSVKTENY